MPIVSVALLLVAQTSNPGEIVSKVFAKYFDTPSLSGTIRLAQSAKGVTLNIETGLQYDRPSKLFIRQVRGGHDPRAIRVASDGKKFSYDKPTTTLGPSRFVEDVTQRAFTHKVPDLYAAAGKGLLDRSHALDILIGRRDDLAEIRARWSSLRIGPSTTIEGQPAFVVEGNYHDMIGEQATGTFKLVANSAYELIRYVQVQRIRVPEPSRELVEVTSVWDVDVKIGGPTDPALYRP